MTSTFKPIHFDLLNVFNIKFMICFNIDQRYFFLMTHWSGHSIKCDIIVVFSVVLTKFVSLFCDITE